MPLAGRTRLGSSGMLAFQLWKPFGVSIQSGHGFGASHPVRRRGRIEGAELPVARARLPADAGPHGEPAELHDLRP